MQRLMGRRTFVKRSTALIAGLVAILGSNGAAAAKRRDPVTYYVLDPLWESDSSSGAYCAGCSACKACLNHAANKVFATAEHADLGRAHANCNCRVLDGGTLPYNAYVSLFGSPNNLRRGSADRRYTRDRVILAKYA